MSLPIIDTHQHLWNLDQFPYSWTKGVSVLARSFVMSDYLAAIEGRLNGAAVGVVLVTHSHADHLGLAARFAERRLPESQDG